MRGLFGVTALLRTPREPTMRVRTLLKATIEFAAVLGLFVGTDFAQTCGQPPQRQQR